MKRIKIKLLLLGTVALLNCTWLYSQSITSGTSSSSMANIAANNTSVTLYSGRPNISIPLHTVNADGIQIPISLSYNASGIKVEQMASQVGLGWSLNAGGVITREMRGYPDEMVGNPGQSNFYSPIGYLYHGSYTDDLWDNPINGINAVTADYSEIRKRNQNASNVTNIVGYKFTGYSSTLPLHGFDQLDGRSLKKDTEADIYHFNFGKYSGKFTFNSDGLPVLLNDNRDLKIEYNLGNGNAAPAKPYGMSHITNNNLGLLEWFKITTPDGTVYTFDKHEIQMVFNPRSQNGINFPESPDDTCLGEHAYQDEDLSSHHVSAWYLSKIENGKSEVILSYRQEIETNHTTSQQLFSGHSEMNHKYTVTEVPSLNFISWNGSQSVRFVRNTARNEFYYPNTTLASRRAKALDEIIISDQSEPYDQTFQMFKKIKLEYDYFNKTGVSANSSCSHAAGIIEAHEERLKLLSVSFTQNWGNGTPKILPPYEFEYDETALPVRHSNRKDLWGYFNGSQPGSYDLAPKLWSYPGDVGHKNTFLGQYSPIPYDNYSGSQFLVNGEERGVGISAMQAGILKKVIYPTGGYTAYEYESNEFTTPAHNNPIKGGGLRIKKITKSNGINEFAENAIIKTFAYEDEFGNKVAGKIQNWPSFANTDPFLNSSNFSSIYSSSGSGQFTSSNNIGGHANVLYSSIVVREEGGKGKTVYSYDVPVSFDTERKDYWNSEYVYNRTVSSIFTNHLQASNSPFAPNPNYGWRVALTEKKVYNESNILLQKTVNDYEIAKAEKIKRIRFRYFLGNNIRPGIGPVAGTSIYSNGVLYYYSVNPPNQPKTNHEYAKYYDISGWYRLTRSTVYNYDETNPAIAVTQSSEFGYSENHKRITEKRALNSDGTTYIAKSKFPFDYNVADGNTDPVASVIWEMKNRFINSFPIESISMIEPSGESVSVTGGRLIKPVINSLTGNVVAGESWGIDTNLPIPNFVMSLINRSGGFSHDFRYTRKSVIAAFNDRDHPIQTKIEHAQPSAMLWQTESPYAPIAEVVNAERSDIGSVSFEQPTFHEEWDFSQNTNNGIVAGGHTGANHYEMRSDFAAGGVFKVSNQSGKYKCSAWIKSASGVNLVLTTRKRGVVGIYPSSGPTYQQTNSGNTNGEWKHVEVEIDLAAIQAANGSLSMMDVHFYFWNPAQQLVLIDDIRFSPSASPMQTSVYNPLSQRIAGFDQNNRKVTTDYTAEGKLLYVRNEDGDILSANEYNISSNPLIPSYQKNIRVRNQGKKTRNDIDYLGYYPSDEWSSSIAYFDGLSRPIQQIGIDASPTREDIIQPIKYENYGQRIHSYLAYADGTGSRGSYRNNALADQGDFYSYHYQDPYAYNTAYYDESPLNRVKSIRPMGNQYAGLPANQLTASTFTTNVSGEVYLLDGLESKGFYHAASLFVTESQDLKGNKSWQYVDAIGRTIMVKQDVGGGEFAKTYYSYTKKGQLLAIIPPEQTKILEASNWTLAAVAQLVAPKNQLYLYEYDDLGRLTLKWTPESKEEYVYDRLDRLVLSNDSELKKASQWKFIKYDQLNRPIELGIYTHGNNGIPTISNVAPLWEIKQNGTLHGYSNQAFPTVGTEIQNVNYFDNYDRTGDGVADESFSPVTAGNFGSGWTSLSNGRVATYERLFGFPTMTKTALLDNSGTMLKSSIFYNRYGQAIQASGDNHLGGTDQFDFIMDFEGKVREKRQLHSSNPTGLSLDTYLISETYNYDHEGRLIDQTHQINSGPVVTLKANEYGPLGKLKGINLHKTGSANFLEKVGYSYDVMGRTTTINTNSGSGFFKENISYDLNSNVASTRFQMPVRNPNGKVDMCPSCPNVSVYTHQYDFNYDKLNRLTSAAHNIELLFTGNFVASQYPGRYSVNDITYNFNSDILTLNRNGFQGYSLDPNASTRTTIADFGSIDELSYTYNAGRLVGVNDAALDGIGFTELAGANNIVNPSNVSTHEYLYNDNGHLIKDKNKGIDQVSYNYMNLASSMQMNGGVNRLDWLYSAGGQKLRKITTAATPTGINTLTIDYSGIFEYKNKALASIRTEVGRVVPNGTSFSYEYVIKDHQGNSRITFSDLDGNGLLVVSEILQQNHYYPFGMRMNAIDNRYVGAKNLYQFGDKEKQEDFNLNLSDYGPRYYDASIGRWHAPDILREKYHNVSAYNYVLNNPITLSDPTGMSPAIDRPRTGSNFNDYGYGDDYGSESEENVRVIQDGNDFRISMGENYNEDLGDGSSFYDEWTPVVDSEGNVTYLPDEGDTYLTFLNQYHVTEEEATEMFNKAGLSDYAPQARTSKTWKGTFNYRVVSKKTFKANSGESLSSPKLLKLRSFRVSDESKTNHLHALFVLANSKSFKSIKLDDYFDVGYVDGLYGASGLSFSGTFELDGVKIPFRSAGFSGQDGPWSHINSTPHIFQNNSVTFMRFFLYSNGSYPGLSINFNNLSTTQMNKMNKHYGWDR